MKIETNRLLIRKLCVDDLEDSFEHRGDPEVSRYVGEPLTKQQTRERLEQAAKPWNGEENDKLFLAIELRDSNKLIGELMFKYSNLESQIGEVGYRVSSSYQGKGYAYEASKAFIKNLFKELNLHKVTAFCVTENEASWRLMEKLGMKREGLLKSHYKVRGAWHDSFMYAVLNE